MSINKTFALFGFLVVAIAVITGLYLVGSPGEQRLLRFDERRVEDLRILSRAIERRWDKTVRLPQELVELVDGQRLGSIPLDPTTGLAYVYELISINAYRLCADFSKSSLNPQPNSFWVHESGYQCFTFTLVNRGD
jgi:hypothetical protein